MKQGILKKLLAVVSCAVMLCSLMSVGTTADNGLEIWADTDIMYFPLASEFYPYCNEMPEGVTEEDLVYSFSNEEIVRKVDEDYITVYQMIAPGETELTVQTKDGAYSDTVTIVVDPAIPMTSDSVTAYTNIRYQARCFSYVPKQDGVYEFSLILKDDSMNFIDVFDAGLESVACIVSGETVLLTADTTYYFSPIVNSRIPGDTYEFQVKYLGETVETPVPTSLVFAQDAMQMSLYDVRAIPSLSFEPGGDQWYDDVTFEVSDESVLTVDADAWNMTPLKEGTVTLTATAVNEGWSDSITVTVTDVPITLTKEETIALSVVSTESYSVFFTAPEAGSYVFYSVTTDEGDPYCVVYDALTGEEINYSDDVNGYDFAATIEMEQGQTVMLRLYGYQQSNAFELHCGAPMNATGVELLLSGVISQDGDVCYIESGMPVYADVAFLGGLTVMTEEYELFYSSDDVIPDEYGEYYPQAGQSVTVTVTTESGLTDTVTVKAIDLLAGDLNFDGNVDLTDATVLFYAINGAETSDTMTLGAMEITGDNRITLADVARLFYVVNGLLENV